MDKKEVRRILRNKIDGALDPFNSGVTYGLDIHVPSAHHAIMQACEQFHKNMSKIEKELKGK